MPTGVERFEFAYIPNTTSPTCSLAAIACHAVPEPAAGLTQASTVMPVVKWSEGLSGIVTHESTPLNDTAPPNFPPGTAVTFVPVPLFPAPVASARVPDPSNGYAATSPVAADAVPTP